MTSPDRIRRAYETAKAALLAEMVSEPVAADDPVQKLLDAPVEEFRHWVGELSTSALSTATAVMALEQMRRQYVADGREVPEEWLALIRGGVDWLIAHQNADGGWGDTVKNVSNISTTMLCRATLVATSSPPSLPLPLGEGRGEGLETTGLQHAANAHEGGSETGSSSTSSVDRGPHPAFGHPLPGGEGVLRRVLASATGYIDRAGGVPALIARYGKDRTFSVPILTHCALAGLVGWADVIALPFELAAVPAKFYAAVRMPVVSYALPALIAIGQVRFHFRPPRNPLLRWLRKWAAPRTLTVLERIQPTNGGFLEATPLTSFVTMSLAAMGLHDHPVAQKGIEFIVASARREGVRGLGLGDSEGKTTTPLAASHQPLTPNPQPLCSWPIDTNLATWVTTLSINALGDDVPLDARPGLRAWLLRQQYRVVHPYTNAAPGGWAWTDLPGGVPDADDTPGAMLALMNLSKWRMTKIVVAGDDHAKLLEYETTFRSSEKSKGWPPASWTAKSDTEYEWTIYDPQFDFSRTSTFDPSSKWLIDLQNRNGGWPTFCRGWGKLPFDRSSPDITAHAIRSLAEWIWPGARARPIPRFPYTTPHGFAGWHFDIKTNETLLSIEAGLKFLKRTQRPDGSWLPLWFGNQQAPNDENPTYGTAKVLAAFQALGRMSDESAVRGVRWLVENQNPDGGWGAGPGTPSSIEETALALEALLGSMNEERGTGNEE